MKGDDRRYEVGYSKPPKNGQFTKGQSGNPKGRPKGSKNFAATFLRESRKRVQIKGPGGIRTITKLEAVITQMGNKAVQGHLASQREYLHHVQRSEEEAGSSGSKQFDLDEPDREVMKSLLHRMGEIGREESAPTDQTNQEENNEK
ncbi:MAG TPA: DUF5681 domain-containing protein [Terracidiphilus sp.]|jgi:hypothetical protein